ncbi:MAG: phosphatidate cytidylyltransferase [Bacteroidetes bacterium]|nr:phosphatidate cytidylyltransferase [Bacteroidota bacterium]
MNDILKRSLSGAVFIALFLGAVWGGFFYLFAFLFLVNIIGVNEYIRIFSKDESTAPHKFLTYLASTLVFVVVGFKAFLTTLPEGITIGLFPLILLFLVMELFRKGEKPFQRAATGMLAVIYISLPLAIMLHLGMANVEYDPTIITASLILIWSNDTFAYLVGRSIGKTPFFPAVSPNKTWEGSIGGAVCAIGVAFLLSRYWSCFTLIEWLGLAVIFVVFSSLGDLVESRMKRSFDVKDSGNLMPGHGGILDRFDAMLFSVPFAYAFLQLIRIFEN